MLQLFLCDQSMRASIFDVFKSVIPTQRAQKQVNMVYANSWVVAHSSLGTLFVLGHTSLFGAQPAIGIIEHKDTHACNAIAEGIVTEH